MTLSYLRKTMAAAGLPTGCMAMNRGNICLDPATEVFCDHALFTQEAERALRYSEDNNPYAVPAMEQAVRIYTGDFLPENLYDSWTHSLRHSLRNLYLDVIARLAQAQYTRNNLTAALQACNKYLTLEPVDEILNRLTMDILCKMGKKHKAILLYRQLTVALDKDYNTCPEPETTAIYRRIQNQA